MNTMPTTAPTSADACLSIVHSLMCHRVSRMLFFFAKNLSHDDGYLFIVVVF